MVQDFLIPQATIARSVLYSDSDFVWWLLFAFLVAVVAAVWAIMSIRIRRATRGMHDDVDYDDAGTNTVTAADGVGGPERLSDSPEAGSGELDVGTRSAVPAATGQLPTGGVDVGSAAAPDADLDTGPAQGGGN